VALTVNTSVVCTSGCTGVSTTAYSNDPTTVVINAHGFPYLNPALPVADRVSDLLSRMTLAEKVGQMIEPERPAFTNANAQSNSGANNIRAWGVGSILSGGGSRPTPNTPTGWANLIDNFMVRSLATPHQIPLVYGLDTVHGDNNLQSATIFPHNIGIGATRDPELSLLEGEVTAAETRATGPHWGFAPCICVARDIRWGRTYESYGEDPALVELMETEIDGMQGTTPTAKGAPDKILATAKHYAGDGGTTYGTGSGGRIDQGITQTSYDEFQRLHVSPYVPAVQVHHVGSIMPSYSSVDYTDDGLGNPVKMSAEANLLTTVLKQQIGFEGFLISDYNALDQIPAQPPPPDSRTQRTRISVNAGMDMIMVPGQPAYKQTTDALFALGTSGDIPPSRIDDAVSRILRQKFELGLFDHPLTDRSNVDTVGSAANRAIARRAAAESQVLLANDGVLPLAKTATVYLAGSNADNMGRQVGGWTGSWQGSSGNSGTDIPTGGTNLRTAIENVVGAGSVTFSATAVPAPAPGSADLLFFFLGFSGYAYFIGVF
jgi:beta-glucosidase